MTCNATATSLFEALRKSRPLLLGCEAIGWLHMLEKAHVSFLNKHARRGHEKAETQSDEGDSCVEKLVKTCACKLKWLKERYQSELNKWPSDLSEFFKKYNANDSCVLGLLQAGHAMASGIEKQSYDEASVKYLRQDATHLWLSSPFGHPRRNLLVDPPDILTKEGWRDLVRRIEQLLRDLKKRGSDPAASRAELLDNWWQWREDAIGSEGWLRRAFLSTLAETRIPNNDVTLWDQSYVAAALFKSAVAGAVLVGHSFNWQDVKRKTRWRVLTIGFGTDYYEERAVRIGDWVGAQRDIEAFFRDIRRLIEVDLALGSLVYRDSGTLVFTFPGLEADATCKGRNGSRADAKAHCLFDELKQQIDKFASDRNFETPPYCSLSDPTRSFIPMIKETRQARSQLAVPLHRAWSIPSDLHQATGHVCPVCRVRFNGSQGSGRVNVDKQKLCHVCRERRRGRLAEWLKSGADSIWISEVADSNGRVALLTLTLGLEPWLDGTHVDSLRAQSIPEWRRHNPKLGGEPNCISLECPHDSLVCYIASKIGNKIDKMSGEDPVLQSLQRSFKFDRDFKSFFAKVVEDRSEAPSWDKLTQVEQSGWLAHQLFRKLPSPGRVYRFWRTAEEFFDALERRFKEQAAAHPNRWRTRRLFIEADRAAYKPRDTYLGFYNNAPFELLCTGSEGSPSNNFVTICNLARVLQANEAAGSLKQQTIRFEDDDGQWHELKIAKVRDAEGNLGCYHPVIVLEKSPLRFRLLVPLEAATQCIEAAILAWREEFARVFDRMPLAIGVVAFPRLTPFQAVIEAARNLEQRLAGGDKGTAEEVWRVCRMEVGSGSVILHFQRDDKDQEQVTVPTVLPDGRDDVFYPYLRVSDDKVRYERDFKHPKSQVYRHVSDLRLGDTVKINPSRFAAVFLDTTARRFEPLQVRPLSHFCRMREVWRVLRRAAPSMSVLHGIWMELEMRKRSWQGPHGQWSSAAREEWREFARALLGERLQVTAAELNPLVEAAEQRVLEMALEWHLSWLKEQVEG